ANEITVGRAETGIVFDDETSYDNNVTTRNMVNGEGVQWHVGLVGTLDAPIVLHDVTMTAPNATNVAQLMLYRSSYVRVENATASNGTRGVYVLRSSSIDVSDVTATFDGLGVEIRGTATVNVLHATVTDDGVGILVTDSPRANVTDSRLLHNVNGGLRATNASNATFSDSR